jgi:predicted metal-binding protein
MSNGCSDKLEMILSRLKERGASAAQMMDVSDIVVDDRVRLKCQVPLCESYQRNLMCPPFVPAVGEFRDALCRYSSVVLIQVSAELKESPAALTEEVLLPAKKLHGLVHFGEREAFAMGFRFAAGFIGSCCHLCSECAAIEGSLISRSLRRQPQNGSIPLCLTVFLLG